LPAHVSASELSATSPPAKKQIGAGLVCHLFDHPRTEHTRKGYRNNNVSLDIRNTLNHNNSLSAYPIRAFVAFISATLRTSRDSLYA
jgi:hypothetical protein